jgi:hypothetical protein
MQATRHSIEEQSCSEEYDNRDYYCSVTEAIENKGAAKSIWKKEKLEGTKAW